MTPDPGLNRALFFVPLFLIEIITLALFSASDREHLTRPAVPALALMLLVFGWGLGGFGYPDAPFPIAMNVVSKLLAFAAVLALFRPAAARPSGQPGELVSASR